MLLYSLAAVKRYFQYLHSLAIVEFLYRLYHSKWYRPEATIFGRREGLGQNDRPAVRQDKPAYRLDRFEIFVNTFGGFALGVPAAGVGSIDPFNENEVT
jgi:hypothetical protein